MTDDCWVKAFDRTTPFAVLPQVIEHFVHVALVELRDQLAHDEELTDQQRAAIVSRATPLIYAQTRQTIESGWQRLQSTH